MTVCNLWCCALAPSTWNGPGRSSRGPNTSPCRPEGPGLGNRRRPRSCRWARKDGSIVWSGSRDFFGRVALRILGRQCNARGLKRPCDGRIWARGVAVDRFHDLTSTTNLCGRLGELCGNCSRSVGHIWNKKVFRQCHGLIKIIAKVSTNNKVKIMSNIQGI